MNPELHSSPSVNKNVLRAITYVLIFLMMACMVMTMGGLLQDALPNWHTSIIAGITLFVVIDRLYTYPRFKTLMPFSTDWVITFGAQWAVIVLSSRILLSYAKGLDSFRADLSLFTHGYLADLFDAEFAVTLILALLAWYLSTEFLGLLEEIGLDAALALSEAREPSRLIPAHQRLANLVLSLGIVLVILTALTRLNLRAIFAPVSGATGVDTTRFSGGEAAALLYFLLGLGLLSLSRLLSLHTHWNQQRVPVSSSKLTRQWGIYSLVFLLLLAVFVSLLPSGDSLGFFSLLGTVFSFLISVIFFIWQLIIALIFLLLSLPFLLFGKVPPFLSRLPPPTFLPPPPADSVSPQNNTVLAWLRSIFLWAALLAILIFSFIRFIRQHEGLLPALRKARLTNWLILAWQWLYKSVNRTRESLAQAIADGWQSSRCSSGAKRRSSACRMDQLSVTRPAPTNLLLLPGHDSSWRRTRLDA